LPKDITDKFRSLEGKGVPRYKVYGKITNILGEWDERTQAIKETILDEVDKISKEVGLTGHQKGSETKRAKKRVKIEEVHTFPTNGDGELLVPLGGQHGYIMGALKRAIFNIYKDKLKKKSWKGYGIKTYLREGGIWIEPKWVSLGVKEFTNPKDEPKTFMDKTAGRGQTVVYSYYDYVEEAEFEPFIIGKPHPKIPEEVLLRGLAGVQRLGLGPKGRGSIEFTKIMKLDSEEE